MRETQRYSLIDVDQKNLVARVARDGHPLEFAVSGVILEAQHALSDGSSLLWLTEGSPYDEALHVYLIGHNGNLEDAIEAGAAFSPGFLKFRSTGEDWAEFEFFQNEIIYRLEITARAKPRLFLPTGWRYERWLASHRLVVSMVPTGARHA